MIRVAAISIPIYTTVACTAFIRVVHSQTPIHYFGVIEVAHSCCRLICVCKLCEAKTLRPSGVLVEDEAEVQNCSDGTESLNDLFLGETWSRELEKNSDVSRR